MKLILLCFSKLLKFDCAENLVENSSVVFLRVFKQVVRNKLKRVISLILGVEVVSLTELPLLLELKSYEETTMFQL